MAPKPEATSLEPFRPRAPTLLALALLTAWILLLCLPMFTGKFLVNPSSDQMWTGVPFRWFGAGEWRRTGHLPLWNPFMFGGLPFVGAMHGDIFYPTAWLRLVLPIDIAMNLGFAVHCVLAGLFAYLFFRVLKISWTGSVVGGLAYQLSGIVASLVSPGHDGKLFVSAWMPVVLTALVLGIRDRRLEGFGLLAFAAGAGIISPHIQMMQYTLILAGLFTLYLCFWSPERPEPRWRWASLGLALAAIVLACGVAMIQLWPFVKYMPYAARSAGAQGWEYATSWAMPLPNVVDWVVSDFTGILAHYSGENAAKLHTEYVGAAVLALAALGVGHKDRRPLVWFFAGAGLLFLLVSLGAHTPFYRIWYALVPGVKVTRAAGMAFFISTFAFALFAALGVERLERGEGRRVVWGVLVAAGALLLLGASGALGSIAESVADPGKAGTAADNAGNVALSAVKAAAFAAAAAGLALAVLGGRLRALGSAFALAALVGGDLFLNVRRFWQYAPRAAELYADDPITRQLEATPKPYRVLDPGVYPTAYLMAKGIPQAIGHHGNELNDYDNLLGGKNVWRNLFPTGQIQDLISRPRNLYQLLAVRFIILPQSLPVPGFHEVTGQSAITPGGQAVLLEADTVPPYARIVPAAAKIPNAQIVPTLMDRRLDVDRIVLLPQDAPVEVPPITGGLPAPSASRAQVTAWEPGTMTLRLDPAPDAPSYVLISENWYPEWRATVDGREVRALRGDYTFLTVPVPAGARDVRLEYSRERYRQGALLTFASLACVIGWIGIPLLVRRRRG